VGDDLRKGVRSIKEIVQFDDEELRRKKSPIDQARL